jgi:hypothetical protein
VHNGPIVIALELAAGLVEGATPALAYSVTHGYTQHVYARRLDDGVARRLCDGRRAGVAAAPT